MAKTPTFPSLDPERKRTPWETIIITTPVILTVVATVLAGLSSSEMSSAQYYRSIAAQMQSKVSDQWGYFQAKKIRADQCGNTVQVLERRSAWDAVCGAGFFGCWKPACGANEAGFGRFQRSLLRANRVESLMKQMNEATTQPDMSSALENYGSGKVPEIQEESISDPKIVDLLRDLNANTPEADMERKAGAIDDESLDRAFTVAGDNTAAFEKAVAGQTDTANKLTQLFQEILREAAAFEQMAQRIPGTDAASTTANVRGSAAQLDSAFAIAHLRSSAGRYDREARYNQVLADLYEVQVRRQGFMSDRHRERSKEFFYGMLGAQAGVTIATFSLAVRRRNLLWGLAASAGLAAVTFAAYVYMFV